MGIVFVVASLGIALWGGYMRLWPPPGDQPHLQKRAFTLLIVLALVAAGASIGRDYLQGAEQAQREQAHAALEGQLRGQLQQVQQQVSEGNVTIAQLVVANAPQPLPPPPVLMLHDIYGSSWGLGQSGGPPANLEAASPLRVARGELRPINPCVMPPESISNVWISLIFPADIETAVDRRLWQEWPEGADKRFMAGFGSLDPNPADCTVKGMTDGSGGPPFQFRPTRRFTIRYRVTGRVTATGVSLSPDLRGLVIEPID